MIINGYHIHSNRLTMTTKLVIIGLMPKWQNKNSKGDEYE